MTLRYTDVGAGFPVVLLHARPADRHQWHPIASLLAAAGYRCIAPDLPGYGESPATASAPAAPWKDVRETLEELGVDDALLVGNSLGAQTALQYAATWPERVTGLCLMGYRRHDQPPSERLQQAWDEEAAALAREDLDAAVESGVRAWLSPSAKPGEKRTLTTALRHNLERRGEPAPAEQDSDPLDQPAWPTQITMPVRILHGADDMPDFAEGAEKLRDALHAPDIVRVTDAAHLIPIDSPAAVATVIFQLLNRDRDPRHAEG